jgi:mono/diheme cytochrome c family protein
MSQDGLSTSRRRGWLGRALSWIANLTLGRLLRWALRLGLVLAVLAVAAFALFVFYPTTTIPAAEPIDQYAYLDQGWGARADTPERETYYYSAQGTTIPQGALQAPLRYDWFVHLELPFSTDRFAAPEHLARYRFIVDPQPSAANPDRLPLGFTRHYDAALGEYVLDVTCAACHSGQVNALKNGKRIAIRIDGGQAMHAFTDMQRGSFAPMLMASLVSTYVNPMKFNRFARQVIGARYPAGKSALRAALWANIKAIASSGQNNPLRQLYPVREGYGRTDALGRIANTVFGDHLSSSNYQHATAPVSYPYLWNIWKFDWVQYNGSVKQPLARNVGEAMGVGAYMRLRDTYGNPLPPEQRYVSSVMVPNLVRIEHALQKLRPPRWPEDLLGAVDTARAERGKALFEAHCVECHGPHVASAAEQRATSPGKPVPGVDWRIEVIPLEHIGTDPTAATAFMENRYDLSATGITATDVAGLLRPMLVRDLARNVQAQLSLVIDGRTAKSEDVGTLPELLAAYPDPNADETPSVPRAAFATIKTELDRLGIAAPAEQPKDSFFCALSCQSAWLAWNVVRGEQDIERAVSGIDIARVTEGEGLNILGLLIKQKYFADNHIGYAQRQCIEGFGTLDLPQQIAGYKPRPLEGVWATPPFLHNGSVPNVYEMLLPPEQRTGRFYVGRRDYDTRKLGYLHEPENPDDDSGFWLDTRSEGNRNTGHAFVADPELWRRHEQDYAANPVPPGVIGPLLSDDERYELVEYLKVHRDPPTPAEFHSPDCGIEQ